MSTRPFVFLALTAMWSAAALPAGTSAGAAGWPQLSSGPLEDNSFLIEEAYNQERGVIQHIVAVIREEDDGAWLGSFTQEWPAPDERHQLSFTLPFTLVEAHDGTDGIGDLLLNYRYQLLAETDRRPAVAPRLSLSLPTGDEARGLGSDTVGVETNLPVSKQLSDHWAAHLNLGGAVLPEAEAPQVSVRRATLWSWHAGASLILEPTPAINLLVETLVGHDGEIVRGGATHRLRATLNPGVRIGWNGPGGVQWVLGASAPIGLTRHTSDVGVLFYLSVEHAITRAARAERW